MCENSIVFGAGKTQKQLTAIDTLIDFQNYIEYKILCTIDRNDLAIFAFFLGKKNISFEFPDSSAG